MVGLGGGVHGSSTMLVYVPIPERVLTFTAHLPLSGIPSILCLPPTLPLWCPGTLLHSSTSWCRLLFWVLSIPGCSTSGLWNSRHGHFESWLPGHQMLTQPQSGIGRQGPPTAGLGLGSHTYVGQLQWDFRGLEFHVDSIVGNKDQEHLSGASAILLGCLKSQLHL